jgi:hypothetical protein
MEQLLLTLDILLGNGKSALQACLSAWLIFATLK